MNIIFSYHAELKIRQRKLSRRYILETVTRPDSILPSRGGREILLKKFRTNHLQVIIRRGAGAVVVVTAHWVARLRRGK